MLYDSRKVKAHGSNSSQVYLVNEAPGPREAKAGCPSYGDQGGNIYRAFLRNDILWVTNFNDGKKFQWPKYDDGFYHSRKGQKQVLLRKKFLRIRGRHITCSNAYDQWPKNPAHPLKMLQPAVPELTSAKNLDRLKGEITDAMRVILICGECAWNALLGTALKKPDSKIGTPLTEAELLRLNERLEAEFELGFYMGHTSKWRKKKYLTQIDQVIRLIKPFLQPSDTERQE